MADLIREELLHQLRIAAETVLQHAYAPYSRYPVGAALLTQSGEIFSGCNVQNAALPSGLCAEASAIGHMVSTLGATPIRAVYVLCKGREPAWPCGSCRQRLNEFALPELWIYTATIVSNEVEQASFTSLFPHSFGPHNLQGIE